MKFITTLMTLFLMVSLFAQTQTESEMYATFLKAEKKAVVAQNMNLNDADAAVFWRIYDDYMKERSQLSQNKGAIAQYYIQNFDSHDPKAIDRMVNAAAQSQMIDTKLMKKYYKKIKKSINEEAGLRFYLIEEQLQLLLKMGLYEGLPLIEMHK